MSDQSKVLTVTFGTFSCTLQGFDDPFPVLRQIADYFQDLAAKDPLFGTRIGTVSADTLALIANMTGGTAETVTGSDIAVRAPEEALAEENETAEVAVEQAFEAPELDTAAQLEPEAEDAAEPEEVKNAPATSKQRTTIEVVTRSAAAVAASTAVINGLSASAEKTDASAATDDDEPPALDIDAGKSPDSQASDVQDASATETQILEATETASTEELLDPVSDVADTATSEVMSDDDVKSGILSAFEDQQQGARAEDDTASAPLLLDPAMQATSTGTETSEGSIFAEDAQEQPDQEDANGLPEWASDLVAESDIAPAPTPVIAEQEPQTPAENTMSERDDSGYGMSTVRLSFGDEPGINQSRDVVPTANPALQAEVVADMTEIGNETPAEFEQEGFSEAPASALTQTILTASEPVLGTSAEPEPAPLVLTNAMSVESQTQHSDEDVQDQSPEDFAPNEPEAPGPVLRLVEPVTAQEAIEDGGTETLREFAENAGAATLPDLLEASAAFVTLVNGRPSFTRGEIMRMVDTFSEDGAFSQEARIKSFGALIRGGRIHRTDTGDFEISRAARAAYENVTASG